MSDMTEQERKKRLAESLRRGERVMVSSSGQVETPEEATESLESTISVPQAKMAYGGVKWNIFGMNASQNCMK